MQHFEHRVPNKRSIFVLMVFMLCSCIEKLKELFGPSGLGAEDLALPCFLFNLA